MTPEECEKRAWPHNQRCRYTHGFHCEDCDTFFPRESPTYRRHEEISSLEMVIHNIGCDYGKAKEPKPPEIEAFYDRTRHKAVMMLTDAEVEALIDELMTFIHAHGKNADSATLTLH